MRDSDHVQKSVSRSKTIYVKTRKRSGNTEKIDFILFGQISEPLLAKMWLRFRPRPQDAGNTFRRSSCKNRPGLTTCPNHFQPMTPRFHTAQFALLSQEDASCKTSFSLIKSRLALGSPGCLFGHFFLRHHAKIALQTRKWLLTASK